jgi:6-phosphogluconolactonase
MKRHCSRAELASALAKAVATALADTVTRTGRATLAVSGGTTPRLFFEQLSGHEIAWNKITVTLVDERQAEESSPRSNAALVKAALLQGQAAAADFVPLYRNVAVAAALSLDVVVLGMGHDGHTASFFPGGDHLAAALDLNNRAGILEINAPAAGEPRLTYTLAKLLSARSLFLHIEGDGKLAVLEKAMSGSDTLAMPIRAVLQADHPLQIHWCP